MPNIKPVSDLRNYDEVLRDIAADLCSEQADGHTVRKVLQKVQNLANFPEIGPKLPR